MELRGGRGSNDMPIIWPHLRSRKPSSVELSSDTITCLTMFSGVPFLKKARAAVRSGEGTLTRGRKVGMVFDR